MKQNSIKILIGTIIVLLAGIIMIFSKGMVFELGYQEAKRIDLNIGKEFDEKELKQITDEIFGNQQLTIQAIEVYKDAACITTTNITDEQKTNLITKVNEKYGTELNAEEIEIETVAHVRGRDIIKPYIIPFTIITVITIVYLAIRYLKLNSLKVIVQSIGIIILSQLLLLSLIALMRLPICEYTIPAILFVYIISTSICTNKFEKELANIIIEENNK